VDQQLAYPREAGPAHCQLTDKTVPEIMEAEVQLVSSSHR